MSDAPTTLLPVQREGDDGSWGVYLGYMSENPRTRWTRTIFGPSGLVLFSGDQPLHLMGTGLAAVNPKAAALILKDAGFVIRKRRLSEAVASGSEIRLFSSQGTTRRPAPAPRTVPGEPPTVADAERNLRQVRTFLQRHPDDEFTGADVDGVFGLRLFSPQMARRGQNRGVFPCRECRSGYGPEVAAVVAVILAETGFGDPAELTGTLAGDFRGLHLERFWPRQAPSR